MMRTAAFNIALALAAAASAKVQTVYLENDWQVQFDAANCDFKVNKIVYGQSTSHVTVFEADKHLLSVGRGNVDDYVIMTAGNIQKFPERQSKSALMVCDEVTQKNGDSEFNITGRIVIDEAETQGGEPKTTDFSLQFSAKDVHKIGFKAEAKEAYSEENGTNYLSMSYKSPVDEEIYGMGL